MSFRWNLSQRQHSDRSFMMNGNELVATSIGITANRTMLSCVLNMDGKDYKYYKSQAEILEAFSNIYNKQKVWAFHKIQKYTHYHRDLTNKVFLPEALNHGNYEALSQFLGKLRTNRVGAYVKLNLQQSKGYFQKAATLLKPATKIIRERIRYGFVRLKKNMMIDRQKEEKGMILDDIDRISSIQNKDSQQSERPQSKSKNSVIKLSYTLIKFNPQFISESRRKDTINESRTSCQKTKKKPVEINIKDLISQTYSKQYKYQDLQMGGIYKSRLKSNQKH